MTPSYPLAFLAGLASFLSPCVFPLVPAYAGYLGSTATGAAGNPRASSRSRRGPPPVVRNGIAFVLGFSTVFIALFYVLDTLEVTFLTRHQREVDVVAGALVIMLGLQTLGIIRFGWLMRERRHQWMPHQGFIGSFVLGVTFAAGWTPCIGPQLGAILQLAVTGFGGLPFMVIYCLGLAIPFLAIATMTERLGSVIRRINRHLGIINALAGCLLLGFGLLLLTGRFTFFNRFAGQSPFSL